MIKITKLYDEDYEILWDMLYEAVYVEEPSAKGPKEELLSLEGINRYVKSFGQCSQDTAYAAEDQKGNYVGAAWYRLFKGSNRGYGYVSDDIPELSIAVKPEFRGKKCGTMLMEAVIEEAKANGFSGLSLSVDPQNPAKRLYESFGFKEVGRNGTSIVMKLDFETV